MSEHTVRTFTREFKEGERLREVAEALEVRRKLLYDWRAG
jgi:transposase-like protein